MRDSAWRGGCTGLEEWWEASVSHKHRVAQESMMRGRVGRRRAVAHDGVDPRLRRMYPRSGPGASAERRRVGVPGVDGNRRRGHSDAQGESGQPRERGRMSPTPSEPRRSADFPDDFKPILVDQAIIYRQDGHLTVLNPETDRQWTLNDTAAYILSRCSGQHSIRDIVAGVVATYRVDEQAARRDVRAAIRQFSALQVIGEAVSGYRRSP